MNGNLKLILGLIWSLIVRYQIGKSKFPPRKLMLAWLKVSIITAYMNFMTRFLHAYTTIRVSTHCKYVGTLFTHTGITSLLFMISPMRNYKPYPHQVAQRSSFFSQEIIRLLQLIWIFTNFSISHAYLFLDAWIKIFSFVNHLIIDPNGFEVDLIQII